MHRDAIPEPVWRLLLGLSGLKTMTPVYLVGGTALALHLGHRLSADLDFLVPTDFEYQPLLHDLLGLPHKPTLTTQTSSHWALIIDSIKVDYLRELIPRRFPLKMVVFEGTTFKVADPLDIGRMKLHAIASRGSRKDFIDLYCLTRSRISLENLLMMVLEEQGTVRFNWLLFLKGLIDFEEAEREVQPMMLWPIAWSEVKGGLTEEVKRIGKSWSV